MKWHPFPCERRAGRLPCTCCGQLLPRDDIPDYATDFGFTLKLGLDATTEHLDRFARAFGVKDPEADLLVCGDCLREYTPDGAVLLDTSPLDWLARYEEEDAKLISREEAIRRLGGS
jgi:hypothetical protein